MSAAEAACTTPRLNAAASKLTIFERIATHHRLQNRNLKLTLSRLWQKQADTRFPVKNAISQTNPRFCANSAAIASKLRAVAGGSD